MNKQQYHTKVATKQNVGQTQGTTNAICLPNIPTAIEPNLRKIPLSNIHLSKNFVVGNTQQNDDLKNRVWVHLNSPAEAPKIEDYPDALSGDILLNINPDMSKPELRFASWICVEQEDGTKAFKGMEAIF